MEKKFKENNGMGKAKLVKRDPNNSRFTNPVRFVVEDGTLKLVSDEEFDELETTR